VLVRVAHPRAVAGVSRRTAALLAAAAVTAACRAPRESPASTSVAWTLRPEPAVLGPAMLAVTLRDPANAPIDRAEVRVVGHMSHPGMAPVAATAAPRGGGRYEAGFAFTMRGDWVLVVSIQLPDGRRVERRIDVPNVQPAP
jgi:hypothetical protein